jgi:hypothetical protein
VSLQVYRRNEQDCLISPNRLFRSSLAKSRQFCRAPPRAGCLVFVFTSSVSKVAMPAVRLSDSMCLCLLSWPGIGERVIALWRLLHRASTPRRTDFINFIRVVPIPILQSRCGLRLWGSRLSLWSRYFCCLLKGFSFQTFACCGGFLSSRCPHSRFSCRVFGCDIHGLSKMVWRI